MRPAVEVMDQIDPHGVGHPLSAVGVAISFLSALGIVPIIVGTLGGLMGICYYGVSLWEMDTVQGWIKNRRERKRTKQIAALEAQQSTIIGELKKLGALTHANTEVQPETNKTVTVIETTNTKQ